MDYKRLSTSLSSVYMLEVENRENLNAPIEHQQINQQTPRSNISNRFNRLPILNRCTTKWFLIWFLCFIAFLNSFIPYYNHFIISPFTKPDDNSIFTYPKSIYNGKSEKHIKMLIVVISDADSYEQRKLIRSKWANYTNHKSTTKILFLVGLPQNAETDLKTESALYSDIIRTSIDEDYYNLPLKTLSTLIFANKHYPQVECLIKADSDNYLNVSNLEDLCDSLKGQEKIVGHCEDETVVIRSWLSKWHIPKFVYTPSTYPLYCFGETYMFVGKEIRAKLLSKLGEYGFDSSRNRRLMPEDAIFSGFLADLAGIERQNVDGFALQKYNSKFDCLNGRACAYSYHLIGEESNFAKAIYQMSKADNTFCRNSFSRDL